MLLGNVKKDTEKKLKNAVKQSVEAFTTFLQEHESEWQELVDNAAYYAVKSLNKTTVFTSLKTQQLNEAILKMSIELGADIKAKAKNNVKTTYDYLHEAHFNKHLNSMIKDHLNKILFPNRYNAEVQIEVTPPLISPKLHHEPVPATSSSLTQDIKAAELFSKNPDSSQQHEIIDAIALDLPGTYNDVKEYFTALIKEQKQENVVSARTRITEEFQQLDTPLSASLTSLSGLAKTLLPHCKHSNPTAQDFAEGIIKTFNQAFHDIYGEYFGIAAFQKIFPETVTALTDELTLTDEALARQLQAQFNLETKWASGLAKKPLSPQEIADEAFAKKVAREEAFPDQASVLEKILKDQGKAAKPPMTPPWS